MKSSSRSALCTNPPLKDASASLYPEHESLLARSSYEDLERLSDGEILAVLPEEPNVGIADDLEGLGSPDL